MNNPTTSVIIRTATTDDVSAIAAIYNHYVRHTLVTFDEEPLSDADIRHRMADVASASLPWLVALENGQVQGYAYAGRWGSRFGYRFSVESTVYLAPDACGRGLGTELYTRLFARLQIRGIHAVVGGIALPNDASVRLHEKAGMVKVAHFPAIGFKFDQWVDVGYWQRTFANGGSR